MARYSEEVICSFLIGFKKSWVFAFSHKKKMAAYYAYVDSISRLVVGFQPVPRFQNFWNFRNIVVNQWR